MNQQDIPHPGLTDQEWKRLNEIDKKEIDGQKVTKEEWREAVELIAKLTKGNAEEVA